MVPGCTHCSKKTKGIHISYHRLPVDQQMRKTWLRRIRRDNLPKWSSCYVCSSHFTQDCFESSLKGLFGMKARTILKPGSKEEIVFAHKSRMGK